MARFLNYLCKLQFVRSLLGALVGGVGAYALYFLVTSLGPMFQAALTDQGDQPSLAGTAPGLSVVLSQEEPTSPSPAWRNVVEQARREIDRL